MMLGKLALQSTANVSCEACVASYLYHVYWSYTRYVTSLFAVFLCLLRLSQPILILVSPFDLVTLSPTLLLYLAFALSAVSALHLRHTHSKMFIGGLNWDTTDGTRALSTSFYVANRNRRSVVFFAQKA